MALFTSSKLYPTLIHQIHHTINLPNPLLNAALKYDRADFLPKDKKQFAYIDDAPILITDGQTTSQPSTILYMLKLLKPTVGDKVLEIGAGVGWQTAILSKLVGKDGKVYSFEINPNMYKITKNNLEKFNLNNVELIYGNALVLASKFAPFNKIIAGASFSQTAINQLANWLAKGGTAVIPTLDNGLMVIYNLLSGPKFQFIEGFVFVRGKENNKPK